MASNSVDRFGIAPQEGVKAPCRVSSTANLTLSGTQTVDGVALSANDRVLVRHQTTATENGIYEVRTGAWVRAGDWDDNSDVISGMLVLTSQEGTTYPNGVFQVRFTGTFTLGTTAPTFTSADLIDAAASAADAQAAQAAAEAAQAAAETAQTGAGTAETNAAASASAAATSATNAATSETNAAASASAAATSATNAATSETNAAASATSAQAAADSVDTAQIVSQVLAGGAIDAVLNGYSIGDFAYVADVVDLSTDIPIGELTAIHFSDDGLRFYALREDTLTVYQYRLDVEWDLTTINTPAETSFVVPAQLIGTPGVYGFCFGDSGKYLYWSEETLFPPAYQLGRIELNTSGDLRGGHTGTIETVAVSRAGTDMYVSPTGDALYMRTLPGGLGDKYGKYAMATAWSLTGLGAATGDTEFPEITSSGTVSAVVQSQTLNRLLAMQAPALERALIYSHVTPFLPTERQLLGTSNITAISDNGAACEGNYGKSLFVVGTSNSHIHKFSMEGPFSTKSVHTEKVVFPKAAGNGIQVNQAAPQFAWRDLMGDTVLFGTGAGHPSLVAWKGNIRQLRVAVGEEMDVSFHIPHDYVLFQSCYIHIHWSLADTGTSSYTFGLEVTYGPGHNQLPCVANISPTIVDTAPGVAHQIMVSEIMLSSLSPTATQLDAALIEPDGSIVCNVRLASKTGGTDPFIHHVDIHYLSTGIGTVNKAPDFYA